jgi:hypothetical protein
MRLQRISFGRSDIPPRVKGDDCRAGVARRVVRHRTTSLDLKLGVFRTSQRHRCTTVESCGRDAPAAAVRDNGEQVVALGRVEALHEPVPALVSASRTNADGPALLAKKCARLDLYAKKALFDHGDEIEVGAVPHRHADQGALGREPLHRG